MKLKTLLLPFFLLWLILVNLKSGLIFLLHPLIKQRFFSFSLICMIIYLVFFSQYLFSKNEPSTIKINPSVKGQEIISFKDYEKLAKYNTALEEIDQKSHGATRVVANLALIKFYQSEEDAYQILWQKALGSNPNHPLFK